MSDPLPLPAKAYVYVIGANDGPQKVGMARDPNRRLALFRTGNMGSLVIALAAPVAPDLAQEAERYAHWLLRDHHARGEWFAVSPDEARHAVEQAIAAVIAGERADRLVGGAGRPRKNPDKLMKQFTHWLDPDDMARVKDLLRGQTISEFVREAIAAEIKRREDGSPGGAGAKS